MNRFLLVIAVGCCLLNSRIAWADDSAPFTPAMQYSADMTVTSGAGTTTTKIFMDNGKARTEVTTSGMQMVSIIRPDQQKMYSVMVAQKMVMVMPFDPKKQVTPGNADGKFELVGPDTVDGTACTKYKVTGKDGKVYFMWIDPANKTPVKMTAEDNSFTTVWKNVKVGPQDAALFEPPAGYQVMNMPTTPSQ